MNNKISLGIAVSLIAIACAITFVLSWALFSKDISSKVTGYEVRDEIQNKIKDIDLVVRANYFGEKNNDTILNQLALGYFKGLDNNNSLYLNASDYVSFKQIDEGIVVGAGLEVEQEESGYIKVTQVYEDSSAAAQNVLKNDVIVEINKKSTMNMPVSTARSLLTGAEGTQVNIKVVSSGEEKIFDLIHRRITIKSVHHKMIETIGYIRLTAINSLTANQLKDALDDLKQHEPKSYIFDVRQLGDGNADYLQAILDQLLPPQVVAKTISTDGIERDFIKIENSEYLNSNFAVLVDNGTKYAAEVFALALKDGANASIIGTNTRGMGYLMKVFDFKDSTAVYIPVAEIKLSKSGNINGIGIKPDFSVTLPTGLEGDLSSLDLTTDTQLAKAKEALDVR